MDWVRPTAIWAMAAVVSATGPPSPMFSPAAVQWTPALVSRCPSDGSPGHWCDRPQPAIITAWCAAELVPRPLLSEYAGRPAWARAWLTSERTCAAASPCEAGGWDGDGDGDGAGDDGGGELWVGAGVWVGAGGRDGVP